VAQEARKDMTEEDSPAERTPSQLGVELLWELNKHVRDCDVEKALALIDAGADFDQEDAIGNSARKKAETRGQAEVLQRMDEVTEAFSRAALKAAEEKEKQFLADTNFHKGLSSPIPATKPLIPKTKAGLKC